MDQSAAQQCLIATIGHKHQVQPKPSMELQQLQSAPKEQCEKLVRVYIDIGDKYFQIGRSLQFSEKVHLLLFLVSNKDVFAQSPYKASGIDLEFICHWLNVDPKCTSKKQNPRRSSDFHSNAIKEEMDKLKGVGAIKEVFYLEWLANIVVVKKKTRKWWCVWTSWA